MRMLSRGQPSTGLPNMQPQMRPSNPPCNRRCHSRRLPRHALRAGAVGRSDLMPGKSLGSRSALSARQGSIWTRSINAPAAANQASSRSVSSRRWKSDSTEASSRPSSRACWRSTARSQPSSQEWRWNHSRRSEDTGGRKQNVRNAASQIVSDTGYECHLRACSRNWPERGKPSSRTPAVCKRAGIFIEIERAHLPVRAHFPWSSAIYWSRKMEVS